MKIIILNLKLKIEKKIKNENKVKIPYSTVTHFAKFLGLSGS